MLRSFLWPCCLSLLVMFSAPIAAQEPATMPIGWQSLSAAEFSAATTTLFDSTPGPTDATATEVTQHAWAMFLNSESAVASTAWSTLQDLVQHFTTRTALLVTGETDAERNASRRQIETNLSTLRLRLATRLAGDPGIVSGAAMAELLATNQALEATGFSQVDRAALFAQWMDANDWQQASLADQSHLFEMLNVDQVDRTSFSARWTGTLSVAQDGVYTFFQLQQDFDEVSLKVWINSQLILDSTVEDAVAKLQSQPISLNASQPASIRVEFVSNTSEGNYPMAVLLWQSDSFESQVIPASVFAPPEGFAGTDGLKGEYFGDTKHLQLVAAELDPGLQMIWQHQAAANIYRSRREAILSHAWPALLDRGGLDAGGREEFINTIAHQFISGMTASQREQFAVSLANDNTLLEEVPRSPRRMVDYVERLHMLPNQEYVVLVGNWAHLHEQPRCKTGQFPNVAESGSYSDNNYTLYKDLAHWFRAAEGEDIDALWEEFIDRPNGECDLTTAYLALSRAEEDGRLADFRQRIDDKLADETITGDQRTTWLLARAYAEEMAPRKPKPLRGLRYLEDAYLEAESSDYRFWALQEQIGRLIAYDKGEYAMRLLDDLGDSFTAPEQRAAKAEWRDKADELTAHYVQFRQEHARAEADAARAGYLAEIKRRRQRAIDRGDDAAAAKYDATIAELE